MTEAQLVAALALSVLVAFTLAWVALGTPTPPEDDDREG